MAEMGVEALSSRCLGAWRGGVLSVGMYALTTTFTFCLEKRSFDHYRPALPYVLPNILYLFVFSMVAPSLVDHFYGFGDEGGDVHVLQFVLFWLIFDGAFYTVHRRLMHGPLRVYHLVHHESKVPGGVSFFNTHFVEVSCNFFAPLLLAGFAAKLDSEYATLAAVSSMTGNILCHSHALGSDHLQHHSKINSPPFGIGVWTDELLHLRGTKPAAQTAKELLVWGLLMPAVLFWVHKYCFPYDLAVYVALVSFASLYHLAIWQLSSVVWLRETMWVNFYSFANFLWAYWNVDVVDFMNWGYKDGDSPEGGKPDVYKFGLYQFVLDHGKRGKGAVKPSAAELKAPVLEVGCGHGGGLHHFHKAGYTNLSGLDFTPSNIAFCQRKWGGSGAPKFEVNNAVTFCPNPREGPHAGKYDTIINIESSHCYPDFDVFLQMCHNALRPGGRFKMCDFRTKEEYAAILRDLKAGGQWDITSTRSITKEVLCASATFETDYNPWFQKLWFAPPLIRVMRNFCNLPGSDIYTMFEQEELVYFVLRLQRK